MLNDNDALTVLAALAQETRLQVIRVLLRMHPAGSASGRIAQEVGGTPSTMSFHLAHLERVGLIRSQRQANQIIYTAVPEGIGGLMGYLLNDCCGGRPDLCAKVVEAAMRSSPIAPPVLGCEPSRPEN